ncbi:hypothetical protein CAQU_12440 [Corynebacterium aquilae DSM 44791]|uniref:Major facilitator superfamily (MFS) profile domain-containing protein n=1 Tax=Corynebacterium aquilae DSM 44791 TaxID=1431546 RepID=A0A1L7CIS0_9CORY|nr:hypothetical protein CAQU_12440 [Corynebacterium aquilae DSM 44791]
MQTWQRVAFGLFAIAFGANVFAPMLPVYKQLDDLSESQVTLIFAVYVSGLVPALVVGGPLSDRVGRRALIRPALLASFAGSVVLIGGASGHVELLAVGRFVAGVGVGLVMAAGAAWLKQVSSPAAGARRATVALSAGFGLGPLVGGMVAEFLPRPDVVPFVVHLVLVALAIPLVWNAPAPPVVAGERRMFPRTAVAPRFLLTVAAWAPWVFGVATISFLTLTSLTSAQTAWPVAYTGLIGSVTMLTGVAVQPWAQRLSAKARPHATVSRAPGGEVEAAGELSRYVPPAVVGLGCATAGLLLGAVVAWTQVVWLVFPAAVLLGASYGIMMVSGLREVEFLAPAEELGALIAVFYSLTYVGFFAPYVLSIVGPLVGYATCLVAGAIVTALSIVPVARVVQRGTGSVPQGS